MMDLIPEFVDGAVVLNTVKACRYDENQCLMCADFAVGIHNWLIQHELNYIVVDLQDEKTVCPEFLVELVQLRKRLQMPFLFAGVMESSQRIIKAFDDLNVFVFYRTPEEAVAHLKKTSPEVLATTPLTSIHMGEPILLTRPRQGGRDVLSDEEGVSEEEVDL